MWLLATCVIANFQPSLSPQAPSKNSDKDLETRLTSLEVGVGMTSKTPYNFHWPHTLSVWEAPAISHYTHSGCPETSRLLLLQSRHLWPSIEQDLQQFRKERKGPQLRVPWEWGYTGWREELRESKQLCCKNFFIKWQVLLWQNVNTNFHIA